MISVDDLWAQVEAMDGPAALPRPADQPLFAEEWHGRLVAMAVETVHRRGLDWDAFRVHLIAALDAHPDRPYYDSFLVAMEAFTAQQGLVEAEAVVSARHRAASYRTTEVAHDDLEVFPVQATPERLRSILAVLAPSRAGLDPDAARLVAACTHAEFQRLWLDGAPRSWRFRMFDTDGDALLTVPLPHPAADPTWDDLRATHLGLPPDPTDRLDPA